LKSYQFDITIIGGGIFGLTSAISLQQRGYNCILLEKDTIPSELAATTDISKVVRMEYGRDELYMEMVEEALPGWQKWNEEFEYDIYHETGICMLTREQMEKGGFEWESYQSLLTRGHHPERLKYDDISNKFPAWKESNFVDGFYHRLGGYAESGKTLEFLLKKAKRVGVIVKERFSVNSINKSEHNDFRIETLTGEKVLSQFVIVAAGAWSPYLIPALQKHMKISGHPVFHLKPRSFEEFNQSNFCVFTADISNTGWYGFPIHPKKKVIKIANHGVGKILHPTRDERIVEPVDFQNLAIFLKSSLPQLQDAEIIYTRRCLYCDTLDGHLWIDWHPENENLLVATGGSGHGFKFAPILGEVIADAFERKECAWLNRFKWRNISGNTKGEEAARYYGNY
jgi:glycine/D-amino acid oxidase-like deaminating enzyme